MIALSCEVLALRFLILPGVQESYLEIRTLFARLLSRCQSGVICCLTIEQRASAVGSRPAGEVRAHRCVAVRRAKIQYWFSFCPLMSHARTIMSHPGTKFRPFRLAQGGVSRCAAMNNAQPEGHCASEYWDTKIVFRKVAPKFPKRLNRSPRRLDVVIDNRGNRVKSGRAAEQQSGIATGRQRGMRSLCALGDLLYRTLVDDDGRVYGCHALARDDMLTRSSNT